jgi:hypothetical protein
MKKSFLIFAVFAFIIGQSCCSSSEEVSLVSTKCLVVKETRASGSYVAFTYRGDLVVKQERKQANGTLITSIDYQYNGNNLIRQQSYDYQTGTKILYFDYKASYQGNNRVFYESKSYNRSRQLTQENTNSAEFDKNGNMIKEIAKQISYLPTTQTFEDMYVYQYNGKLVTKRGNYSKYPTDNTLGFSGYTLMAYDNRGNLIKQTDYNVNNTPISITEFTYNATNRRLSRVYRYLLGSLTILRETSEYDANNNITYYLSEMNGKKVYETLSTYEYDVKGNITKKTEENRDYLNPNISDYQPTPFVTTKETYTNEYKCPQ